MTAAHSTSLRIWYFFKELSRISWHTAHTDLITLNITVRHYITDLISCLEQLAVSAATLVGGTWDPFLLFLSRRNSAVTFPSNTSIIIPLHLLILPSLQDNNCCILQWSFPEFPSCIRKHTSVMSIMIFHLCLSWFCRTFSLNTYDNHFCSSSLTCCCFRLRFTTCVVLSRPPLGGASPSALSGFKASCSSFLLGWIWLNCWRPLVCQSRCIYSRWSPERSEVTRTRQPEVKRKKQETREREMEVCRHCFVLPGKTKWSRMLTRCFPGKLVLSKTPEQEAEMRISWRLLNIPSEKIQASRFTQSWILWRAI